MGDTSDYLKYVTEKIVARLEREPESPEMRRQRRMKREPWVTRWFGQLLPVGLVIWRRQHQLKVANMRQSTYSQGSWTSPSKDRKPAAPDQS